MKKILLLFFVAMLVLHIKTIYAQVTYTLGNTNYYTTYASGGGIFPNSGTSELGMWANTGVEQVVAWRNLQTAGDNSGTIRSLQVGDVFTISVYAAHANGQMGFSLNANASIGSWANRYSNSRLYIQADGTGSWYVNHNGGTTSLNYNVSSTGRTYEFKVFITSLSTCNVEFYVNGGFHSRLMNLTLTGTAGANIDGFSLYLQNDNGNIYWKQTTQHQALGTVDLGYYLTSGTFTPGLVQDGLESNSTSISNTNNINIGGDAGTYIILNQTNTYSGSTTVNTNARLELQNIAALGSTNGVTVTSGGALSLYFASGTNTFSTYATTLNGAGVSGVNGALRSTGGNNTWPGGITLASSSRINADASGAAGSLNLSGAVTLASNTLTIGGIASGVTISGKISGTGVLAKDGTNTLSLSNATNDYSGGTVLTAGTISLANNSVLGSGDLTFGSGATTCTIDVTDNTSRSGTIKVVEASTAGVIYVADGKTFTLNGAITSTGTNAATKFGKSGSGTFIVNANGSSYPGQIQIGNGIVIVQNNGGLGTNITTANRGIDLGLNVGDVSQANNVSVLATDGITVPQSIYVAPNTSSATRTIGLSGSGSTTFNNEIYLDGTLTASGGSGTVTLSGNLINTGGLISSGGNVILSGSANTFSGTTTITAGTLELQSSIAFSAVTVQNGATLKINGSNVTVASLTVNEGGVVNIEPGASLTVTGALTNNAGNSGIVIKSDENGTGSLKHNTAGVAATVARYIPGASNDWHLISSPVVAQPISGGNFADAGGYDFYMWQESGSLWVNYKNQSGGSGSAPFFDIVNESNNFNPGQGYLVAYVAPNTNAKSFAGNLNNGDLSVALKYEGTGEYAGSNFLGNPYPSAINWYSADKSLFSNNFAAVYDPLKSGGAGFINIDGGSAGAYIASGQGFFVAAKLSSNGQTFNFTNAIREHGGTFYKIDPVVDRIELQLGNDEFYDETVIRLKEATLVAQDRDDAPKYFSYDARVPQLYSLSQDQAKLAINSIPSIEETTSVLLGYSIPSDGDYFIRLSAMTGQMEQQGAYLEDLLTGTKVNLRDQNTYSFSAQKDGDPVRFKLTFSTVGIEENNPDNFVVYAHGKDIYISNTPSNAQITLSTLTGQVVMQRNTGGSGLVTLNAASLPKGVYIVTVQGEGARVSRKVVL